MEAQDLASAINSEAEEPTATALRLTNPSISTPGTNRPNNIDNAQQQQPQAPEPHLSATEPNPTPTDGEPEPIVVLNYQGTDPTKDNKLFLGEKILKKQKAYDAATKLMGSLCITSHRLVFTPTDPSNACYTASICLQTIAKVKLHEAQSNANGGQAGGAKAKNKTTAKWSVPDLPPGFGDLIRVQCKDLRMAAYVLKDKNTNTPNLLTPENPNNSNNNTTNTSPQDDNLAYFKLLESKVFPTNPRDIFAWHFEMKPPSLFSQKSKKTPSFSLYSPEKEFMRQGILNPCSNWRLSTVNGNYELCPTYPKIFAVPKDVTDQQLIEAGLYRSKGRIPILSFKHPYNTATIMRCSQPRSGIGIKKSDADDNLIKQIINTNPMSNSLYVLDARPKLNSVANRATGGGYNTYKDSTIHFLGIPNIHAVREAWELLAKACEGKNVDNPKFLSQIEASNWLEYIRLILMSAVWMAELVDKSFSVLCHCSDGWDRTSQLTSLSMLLLDRYYRTLKGFMVLIDFQWVSVGHKFRDRIGHGDRGEDPKKGHGSDEQQRSPIFVQFVECVWQVWSQFPNCFEFNEKFLILLIDSAFNCRFGNFLYNCEKEQVEAQVETETVSLWSFVLLNKEMFINKNYDDKSEDMILIPNTSRARINFWRDFYLRWSWNAKGHYLRHQQYIPVNVTHF